MLSMLCTTVSSKTAWIERYNSGMKQDIVLQTLSADHGAGRFDSDAGGDLGAQQ